MIAKSHASVVRFGQAFWVLADVVGDTISPTDAEAHVIEKFPFEGRAVRSNPACLRAYVAATHCATLACSGARTHTYDLTEDAYLVPSPVPHVENPDQMMLVCATCAQESPIAERVEPGGYAAPPTCEACQRTLAHTRTPLPPP